MNENDLERQVDDATWIMTSSMKFLHTVSVTIENGRLPKVFDEKFFTLGVLFSP